MNKPVKFVTLYTGWDDGGTHCIALSAHNMGTAGNTRETTACQASGQQRIARGWAGGREGGWGSGVSEGRTAGNIWKTAGGGGEESAAAVAPTTGADSICQQWWQPPVQPWSSVGLTIDVSGARTNAGQNKDRLPNASLACLGLGWCSTTVSSYTIG